MAKSKDKKEINDKRPHKSKYSAIPKSFFYLSILLPTIFFAPFMKKLNFRSRDYTEYLAKSLDGVYSENDILSKATKLFADELYGPESLASFEGKLYVGVQDGRILEIANNKYKTLTTLGISNGTCPAWKEKVCGRPLGNRVTSKGDLYTIDAYNGVLKTSIEAENVKPRVIMSSNLLIDGNSSKLLDDLVIDEGAGASGGNVIYMTDASAYFDLSEIMISVIDLDDTGRVIKYDEDSKEATVILKDLSFPNGIELSDDKQSIIVCEINNKRILRHYIRGPKTGTTEIFIDRLPGEPDNIRRSTRKDKETYWVAIAAARSVQNPSILDWFDNKPILRNLILRLVYSIGTLVKFFGESLQATSWILTGWEIKTGKSALKIFPLPGMALEIDSEGNVVSCLQSPDSTIGLLSEVREVIENGKRVLYLGSVYNKYVGKLVLD